MIDIARITGVVLAGGRGQRMGGVDKASQPFGDATLLTRVIARLAPQVGTLLVSGRSGLASSATAGHRVVVDRLPDQPGPLAGIDAALAICETAFLVTIPCDTPFLPDDLVQRLVVGIEDHDVDVAIAMTPVRHHPIFVAMRPMVASSIAQSLQQGRRSISGWLATQRVHAVAFDDESAFVNCNTLDELRDAERRLTT